MSPRHGQPLDNQPSVRAVKKRSRRLRLHLPAPTIASLQPTRGIKAKGAVQWQLLDGWMNACWALHARGTTFLLRARTHARTHARTNGVVLPILSCLCDLALSQDKENVNVSFNWGLKGTCHARPDVSALAAEKTERDSAGSPLRQH